jgi:hypothetical protein
MRSDILKVGKQSILLEKKRGIKKISSKRGGDEEKKLNR